MPGTRNTTRPEVLEFINSRNTSRIDSDLVTWDLIVSGDIFETRAGTAGLAVGLQRREESRDADLSDDANRGDLVFLLGDPDSSVHREVDAIFAELFMPLVGADFGTRSPAGVPDTRTTTQVSILQTPNLDCCIATRQ